MIYNHVVEIGLTDQLTMLTLNVQI